MGKQFATKDFYLSAFLIAENFDLENYYREHGFTTFVFSETANLKDSVQQFYTEKAMVNPAGFGRVIRNLKSLIHSTSTQFNNNELKGTK